jgi:hypothetical protein
MQTKDLAKLALSTSFDTTQMFLGDLSDADLLVRPVPTANHMAWQLAHLIVAESYLLGGQLPGAKYPELPAAIMSLGTERTGKVDPPEGYLTKAQYLDWFKKVRDATLLAVGDLQDSDFDRPNTNSMAKMAPTLGALLILTANHTLMHGGQFSVVRRALGKPVMF